MKVTITDLSFAYDKSDVLHDIYLDIDTGSILALVGANGCGKTTLLKTISGVLIPQIGTVSVDCHKLTKLSSRELARRLAAVEQHVEPAFDFSVREIVEMGRIPHVQRWQKFRLQDYAIVDQALQITQVSHLAQRTITSLSSGERQRVWIAMALSQQPQVLLLDEPTSHLDIHYQLGILDLIRSLVEKQNLTVIMSIHDLNLAAMYADRVALLKNGHIIAVGTPREVFTERLLKQAFQANVQILETTQGFFVVPRTPNTFI